MERWHTLARPDRRCRLLAITRLAERVYSVHPTLPDHHPYVVLRLLLLFPCELNSKQQYKKNEFVCGTKGLSIVRERTFTRVHTEGCR